MLGPQQQSVHRNIHLRALDEILLDLGLCKPEPKRMGLIATISYNKNLIKVESWMGMGDIDRILKLPSKKLIHILRVHRGFGQQLRQGVVHGLHL